MILGVLWEPIRSELSGNLASPFLLCGILEGCAKPVGLLFVLVSLEQTLLMSGMNPVLGETVAETSMVPVQVTLRIKAPPLAFMGDCVALQAR